MVENNILAISNAMFRDKKKWNQVTEKQKIDFFFIFNRYFSKELIDKSLLLNYKCCDKSLCMDLWSEFMKNKPYPKNFWDEKERIKKNNTKSDKIDVESILQYLDIKKEEYNFLMEYHKDFLMEEIKHIIKINQD